MSQTAQKRIEIKSRYGLRYPASKGYYGILMGCQPAMRFNQMAKYTIDVFDSNEDFVTTIICEYGEFSEY